MNPFTQSINALRTMLGAHFDALAESDPARVRVNNRWGKNAIKGARQFADFPAIDVRPVGGRGMNFTATSSSGMFVRAYELGIASDDKPTTDAPESLDAVEWELIRVAAKASVDKLGMAGRVLKVEVESSQQTADDTEQNRGARRWSGVVVVVVHLQVPRSEIIPS